MRTTIFAFLIMASPSLAFDYVVDGVRPQRVNVDEDLALAGIIVTCVFYALPILVSTIGLVANPDDTNGWRRVGLAAPPVLGGALVATNFIDQMNAQDAKEGWAVMPAGAMWGAAIGQVVGLTLLGAAYLGAEREPMSPD